MGAILTKDGLSSFCIEAFPVGGSDEDRTRYLLHAMEALSQVSYGPTVRYLLYNNSLIRQQFFINN